MDNFEDPQEPELKSLIDDIIRKYLSFIGTEKLQDEIYRMIEVNYDAGLQAAEVQFDMNFTPDYNAVNFVQKFAFDNVKGLTEDIKESLRKEMTLGLLNNENIAGLKTRIVKVMDIGIERAKLIAITESNRAHNAGHMQAARESRLSLVKQWNAQPERISRAGNEVPCPICESLDGQIREMNEKFVDKDGKEYDSPVNSHPRCACRVIFIQREDLPEK
jgi:hypothetical protein